MKQKELLNSINTNLARYKTQVEIYNSNSEYDINIHSENVLIPILNLIYDLNLVNVNYSDKKNSDAIDLIDITNKVAIQITSTSKITKIKKTVAKLLASKYKHKIDILYIIILTNRQNSYSLGVINNLSENKIKLKVGESIIDFRDLYRKINEINNIEKIARIEEILRVQFSDIYLNPLFTQSQFEDFREKYKQSCLNNFSRVNFFGLSVKTNRPREVELYSLFVSPIFRIKNNLGYVYFLPKVNTKVRAMKSSVFSKFYTFSDEHKLKIDSDKLKQSINFDWSSDSSTVPFLNLYNEQKHIVIIGKPGAGKSSFIKYSICKILEDEQSVFENKDIFKYLPIRIELHKYNRFKKKFEKGILEYLISLFEEEYQICIEKENLNSIVNSYPTLLFFDGIDEIFDVQERLSVRNDIENYAKSHKNIKAVVTSRNESYDEVSLNNKLFSTFELLDFNEDQVNEYVNKWYRIEESLPATRDREVNKCLHQLVTVDHELKYNPLLLSLILLLYRNELDIPTSKLDIYESCTNTIVETRDNKEKKLDIKLKISNIISLFSALGYWQFQSEDQGKIITFNDVNTFIKNFLLTNKEFKEESDAAAAAVEFLDFAQVRSIFFENKFTHKTFLEYFAAYYLYSYYYSNWKRVAELEEILSKNIGQSSWAVVLELLICKIDSNQITYEVIDDIVERQLCKNSKDGLIFFIQILKYLKNISPDKTNDLILRAIEFCLSDYSEVEKGKINPQVTMFEVLISLSKVEKFSISIESVFSDILKNKEGNIEKINAFAFEFAISSNNVFLTDLLFKANCVSESEYIFILRNYSSLFKFHNYLNALDIFKSKYGEQSLSKYYKPSYNRGFFRASNQFNWILWSFTSFQKTEGLEKIYNSLITLGVSTTIIFEVASKLKLVVNLYSILDLKKEFENTKNEDFKKFVDFLIKQLKEDIYGDFNSFLFLNEKQIE